MTDPRFSASLTLDLSLPQTKGDPVVITGEALSPKELDVYGVRSDLTLHYPSTPNGGRLCRWCHSPVPKGRWSFCNKGCATEYYNRFWWPSCKKQILRRDNLTCAHCGMSDPYVDLEVDHIRPVSQGGDNNPKNLRTLCVDCHKQVTRDQFSRSKQCRASAA